MEKKSKSSPVSASAPIVSLQSFCRSAGISSITAWRFRQRGWLETTSIAGRQYCTAEQIATFKRRAAAGEFAKLHVVPPSPFAAGGAR